MIQEDTIKNIEKVSVDYNTEREKLLLPEYGRCVQQMVDHAKSLEDKEERQRCATTIVALMANMTEQHGDPEDFRQKLWNHLAAIANYELDIDYPVTIEKLEAMTCVCSVGLDMIAIPGDTPNTTIAGIIADESAIGMVNQKTTAVRIIPVIGKQVGDTVEFGGLLGHAPVMPVNSVGCSRFVDRGGRIPAPIHSFKN